MKQLKKIIQPPNGPLIVWFACLIAQLLIPDTLNVLNNLVNIIGFGALFTWAWLEITDGTNVVRQILGAAVMVVLVISHV